MNKDSFGQEVGVGDYVYFKVKTKYECDALSLGRIEKISPSGSLTLKAINTRGESVQKHVEGCDAYRARCEAARGSDPLTKWELERSSYTYKQILRSASSCVKVPSHVIGIDLVQVLS